MGVRTDLTFDFTVSPRIITVDSPSTEITVQDLHDTLVTEEANIQNMTFLRLISSAGKEDLGGGTEVGITSTLQNAKLAFEARPGPTYVQCNVSGGNLVAVDANGASIDPIEATAFTQVVRTSSSSATLIQATAEWTQQEKDDHIGGGFTQAEKASHQSEMQAIPTSDSTDFTPAERAEVLENARKVTGRRF